ncbi:hypothetical protein [Mucilaginibacter lacusdianchii]|uniref:hypothetical protein n=1 Tax=Mucilaginibacter lacusdianchii TaxID=2684211 RepID=UPI00131EAAE6|nr:hypothetical protein [Mucilaginibacter sp. JXJ CY 39]
MMICSLVCAWFIHVHGSEHKKQNAFVGKGASSSFAFYPTLCSTTTYIDQCATSATLNAEAGQSNYTWNTGATTQSIIVNASGTYWWETIDLNNNKVTNGNFSDGNTSFTSQYTYATPSSGALYPEATYTVTTNPRNVHPNFATFRDHTGNRNGNMMVVNGAPTAGVTIWQQSIDVQPNTDYIFSVWFTSVYPTNPGKLNFSINNSPLGDPIELTTIPASLDRADWKNFTVRWNSGTSISAVIGIVNQNTAADGNDFALDDIVFAPVCRNYFNVTLRSNPAKPTIIPL